MPAASLPAPLGTIAGLLPSAALAELLRIGLGAGGDALVAGVVLAVWAVAAVGLTARTFRWD